jgi:hypothetical protein
MNTNHSGRPNKSGGNDFHEHALYKLLVASLPSEFVKKGRLDTFKISEKTRYARYTVYCWFRDRPLSREAAQALLRLSDTTTETEKKGALTKEALYPFLGL